MSSLDTNMVKENMDEALPTIDEVNINDILIDDCLINIFEYLPLKEKLILEFVCKRWNLLSQLSWNHVTSLELSYSFAKTYLNSNKKQNTAFVIQVLRRCGDYLNKLCVNYIRLVDFSKIVKESTACFHNITNLKISKIPDEETLHILLEKIQNLKSISFEYLKFDASILLHLNPSLIEEFILHFCEINSQKYVFKILPNLVNVKILEIDHSIHYINIVIDSLNKSNVEKLTEITLRSDNEIETVNTDSLIKLISRIKHLRKININEFKNDLIENILSFDYLEEIECWEFTNDLLNSLQRFKNLKSLSSRKIEEFTDQCMRNISKCKHLEKLDLFIEKFNLTPEGIKYFSDLENLKTISIIITGIDLENTFSECLSALSKCVNLKKLYFSFDGFTKEIDEDASFPKLDLLIILRSNITNEMLAKIILKSPIIRTCAIQKCKNINNEFINLVNTIKKDSGSTHVLDLHFYNVNIETNNLSDISPLISIDVE